MSRLEEEMQKSRVVVTGMGAITPIGLTVEEFWENVKAQKSVSVQLQNLIQRILR